MQPKRCAPTVPPPPDVPGARWVPLTKNKYALIDESDWERVSQRSWACSDGKYGYAISGRGAHGVPRIYLHEFIIGKNPDASLVIDHKNRDRWDNRRVNLRWVTRRGNVINKVPKKPARVGYRGVTKTLRGPRFSAKVGNRYLGSFTTAEEAARAYDAAARLEFGDLAVVNFQEG